MPKHSFASHMDPEAATEPEPKAPPVVKRAWFHDGSFVTENVATGERTRSSDVAFGASRGKLIRMVAPIGFAVEWTE